MNLLDKRSPYHLELCASKKACEFLFLQLDGSQELTSCNLTHGETSYQGVYTKSYLLIYLSRKSILSTLYHQIFESEIKFWRLFLRYGRKVAILRPLTKMPL